MTWNWGERGLSRLLLYRTNSLLSKRFAISNKNAKQICHEHQYIYIRIYMSQHVQMYRAKWAVEASFSLVKHKQLHECVMGTNVKLVRSNRLFYHVQPIARVLHVHIQDPMMPQWQHAWLSARPFFNVRYSEGPGQSRHCKGIYEYEYAQRDLYSCNFRFILNFHTFEYSNVLGQIFCSIFSNFEMLLLLTL